MGPEKVDCKERTKLQSSLGTGHCVRENGNFALPAEVSCSQYIDCRGGEGNVQSCGAGAVFDEILGCVHPDETSRPGCTAVDQYEFKCPTFGLRQRFGDHDRLPHPTDCKLFYACLRNGLPRLLGCEKPTVFNPKTGTCDDQKNVPGCEASTSRRKWARRTGTGLRRRLGSNSSRSLGWTGCDMYFEFIYVCDSILFFKK